MSPLPTTRLAGPGDTVAPFTLLPYRGTHSVSWRPGQVTVLSFCALWCDTWREQSARLAALRRRLAGLPITYHTLSVDGRWAERFATGTPADPEVLLDTGGEVSASLGLRAVPWTLALDAHGVIRFARQGIVRTEELEALLRRLATGRADTIPAPDLYLTFDDFPALPLPGTTTSPDDDLLDLLRAAAVPATFFVIGEHLTHPIGATLARRAVREGHRLQLHAWDHSAVHPDLVRCAAVLRAVTATTPTFYRPPGHTDLLLADGITPATPHYPTVAPYDHQRPGVAELTRRVLFAARPGTILQLHAGVADTRAALPDLLAALRRRGLRFALL